MEMLFYKIFTQPITTREKRGEGLLAGNLFTRDDIANFNLNSLIYKSLLETALIHPKKKHIKKIVSFIVNYETAETLNPKIIDMIIEIGIQLQYPRTVTEFVEHLITGHYQMSSAQLKEWISFLLVCKSHQNDAKDLVALTTKSKDIEIRYELIRPFIHRAIRFKSGQELLNLFEDLRKVLKLNETIVEKELEGASEKKQERMFELKREFYDGIITDLLKVKGNDIAEIVHEEKLREKMETNLRDVLIHMEIAAAKNQAGLFSEKFEAIFGSQSEF
jgi:hypothetical protein